METGFHKGDRVYIIDTHTVREAVILSCAGGLYTIRFTDKRGGGIRVKANRLFRTYHEAEEKAGIKKTPGFSAPIRRG